MELEVGEELIFEFRSFESAEAGLWVKAAVVGTSPHAFGQKGLVSSTRVVVFSAVPFRRLSAVSVA